MGCQLSRSTSQEDVNAPNTTNKRKGFFGGSKALQQTEAPNHEEDDVVGETVAAVGRHGQGQAVLSRRDTPAGGLLIDALPNGFHEKRLGDNNAAATSSIYTNFQDRLLSSGVVCSKPIGQSMESESQADFFRMLDAKIAQGRVDDTDMDVSIS